MSTAAASPGFICKLKDRKEVAEGTMVSLPKMLSGANTFEISDIKRINIGAHRRAFRT